ncbi:hypothetical protein [Pseudaestuariivita rosea]|uniref:hypothetical protein n=1 Tax=Pseudaestuariivita rosea TaxID=2763263 RepID=UPI001ABB48FB|nr:hypothetical protein [Pseudaestuariivita rosea]
MTTMKRADIILIGLCLLSSVVCVIVTDALFYTLTQLPTLGIGLWHPRVLTEAGLAIGSAISFLFLLLRMI